MFNINEKAFSKFEKKYPDVLEKVADQYNNFSKDHDFLFIYFNQHLKLFPIIDSWRIEVCYFWDITRTCLISALTNFETKLKNKIANKSLQNEFIYNQRIVEFFLENTVIRLFSLLEKISHPVNILYNLELDEKQISYPRIKKLMIQKHPNNRQTRLILKFHESIKDSSLLSHRHSYIHRRDPLSYFYQLEKIQLTNGISAEIPVKKKPEISAVNNLLADTEKLYNRITKFIDKSLNNFLVEINQRVEDERREFANLNEVKYLKNKSTSNKQFTNP